MPTYVFKALFTASKVGVAPASAPTVDVCNGAGTLVVTGGTATAMTGITGLYSYSYTGTADEYVAIFKTATTTVDLQHIPSWTPTVIVTNLDAAVSTRSTLTAAQAADAVWDEALSGHATAGSAGAALTTAAADPLLNTVPGSYASGTAGSALGRIGSAGVTIVSPVASDGSIRLVLGDDYLAADGRALDFALTTVPTLTGGTVALRVLVGATELSFAGSVTGAAACRVELTRTQIATIGVGLFPYTLRATLITSADVVTLVQATLIVADDLG